MDVIAKGSREWSDGYCSTKDRYLVENAGTFYRKDCYVCRDETAWGRLSFWGRVRIWFSRPCERDDLERVFHTESWRVEKAEAYSFLVSAGYAVAEAIRITER